MLPGVAAEERQGIFIAQTVTTAITVASGASSSMSLWLVMNQYQMMICFIMMSATLTDEVKQYLTDFSFSMMNFDFLPKLKIPTFKVGSLTIKIDEEIFMSNFEID
jgi:hypothetical protein